MAFFAVLMLVLPYSLALDCVKFPPIPSHGTFSVSGGFQATLICADPEEDVALNAPGENGILFCDPHSTFNYDLQQVKRPICNPMVVPSKIKLPVLLGYLVKTCDGELWETFKAELRRLINKRFVQVPKPCGARQTPCIADLSFICRENWAVPSDKLKFHAEAHFSLTTAYLPQKGLHFYSRIVQETRERAAFTVGSKLTAEKEAMWLVNDTKLIDYNIRSWIGTCEEHKNTVGTNLERVGTLTCRGCSRKYVLNVDQCEPCRYNAYTRVPFQTYCEKCPPEIFWKNKQEMIDMCFTRP